MTDAINGGGSGSEGPAQHWFARRERTSLLYFKVNRRPFPQQQLSAGPTFPEDVFDHFAECLLFGEEVETGRAYKRMWVLGNRSIDVNNRLLTGQIGFRRDPQLEAGDRFDEEERVWVDEPVETETTARAPFVFDAQTRILAVLKHPNFPDGTVQNVLTILLNRGEQDRETPAVEWDVVGTLDEPDFWEWVRTADAVTEVTVSVKLPNPEGSPDFDPLLGALKRERQLLSATPSEPPTRTVASKDSKTTLTYVPAFVWRAVATEPSQGPAGGEVVTTPSILSAKSTVTS